MGGDNKKIMKKTRTPKPIEVTWHLAEGTTKEDSQRALDRMYNILFEKMLKGRTIQEYIAQQKSQ